MAAASPRLDTAIAELRDLVAFDTTSRNSNLPLIDHVEAKLATLGAVCERIPNADGTKANLHARFGPAVDGGVILSGHTDVVPVDGQPWSTDPWSLTEKDGLLYGRGTCDMKGFSACILALAPAFAAADLKKPLHIALSYDEEVGCLGAPALIDRIMDGPVKPAIVVVGEPTGMKVVTAHKGLFSLTVKLRGREAHSSLVKDGACAVTHAVPLMQYLVDAAAKMEAAAPADSPFNPPYGTLTIGQMHGGTALNILALEAEFASLMRPAPWDDVKAIEKGLRERAAAIEAKMREGAPEARIEIKVRSDVPAFAPEVDGAAERLARQLTGDNSTRVVSYGTEAGQFQAAGLSVVVCGPGSITQAHQPDEFVAIDQLDQCCVFMEKLVRVLEG
ncbi:MAG: acetylornithine deacetylase [Oceanicaulis sp.]|nr:acetylornithine deacetylase [Oceanicaulis sp.]MAZ91340.1 acetylornithine deacetylase [Maricaulis sp.]MBI74555.1 acetylornithine deacetylase [Oceanicaulis sp.]|tara:strand:- start:161 stop:1330 length:1170 start_codon:yes stop_codon:yes gene_type:complete